MAPSGTRTQSKREALEPLLATHFPKLIVTEGMVAPAAAHHARQCDWQVAAKCFTYRRVEWGINFLALLQEGQSIVIPYLFRTFCSCLVTGYVPTIWHQFKRVFIPKTCRSPILDLGILDTSVSHNFCLRPWRGWWIGI